MPTYDYRCEACGHAFEEFHSMSAKPLRKCPECGKQRLKRLFGTGAGIIFKGSGFYETDYKRKSGGGKRGDGDGGSSKDAGGGGDGAKKDGGAKDAPAKGDSAAKPAASGAKKKDT